MQFGKRDMPNVTNALCLKKLSILFLWTVGKGAREPFGINILAPAPSDRPGSILLFPSEINPSYNSPRSELMKIFDGVSMG